MLVSENNMHPRDMTPTRSEFDSRAQDQARAVVQSISEKMEELRRTISQISDSISSIKTQIQGRSPEYVEAPGGLGSNADPAASPREESGYLQVIQGDESDVSDFEFDLNKLQPVDESVEENNNNIFQEVELPLEIFLPPAATGSMLPIFSRIEEVVCLPTQSPVTAQKLTAEKASATRISFVLVSPRARSEKASHSSLKKETASSVSQFRSRTASSSREGDRTDAQTTSDSCSSHSVNINSGLEPEGRRRSNSDTSASRPSFPRQAFFEPILEEQKNCKGRYSFDQSEAMMCSTQALDVASRLHQKLVLQRRLGTALISSFKLRKHLGKQSEGK